MEMRHMRIKEGARVWVNTPAGQPAARGWANGLEALALKIHEEQIRKVTIRDATGREITVPHYEVLAGYEYRGKADWVPETDPRVLDWLESELRKGHAWRSAAPWKGTTNRGWSESGKFCEGTGDGNTDAAPMGRALFVGEMCPIGGQISQACARGRGMPQTCGY